MYNWNDVKVEQEIAQERYERIIEARRADRLRRPASAGAAASASYNRLLGWVGDRLVRWGCALQGRRGPDLQAAVCRPGGAS